MLTESLLADLRCPDEHDIQAPFTVEHRTVITLRQFIEHAAEKMDGTPFFLVACFEDDPKNELIIKYKFQNEIFVDKDCKKYLDHPVTKLENILDDGGYGTFITVA